MVRALSFVVVVSLVLSATFPAALAASVSANGSAAVATASAGEAPQVNAPDDPEEDVIGWENGYWYNESIDVDQSDGLSEAETEAFVARSMARVEYLREAEFNQTVPVEVISRDEYRNSSGSESTNTTEFDHWNDQVWEALFIVGESTGSSSALGETTGSSVAGYYSPVDDEIKVITDDPDTPTVNNATLVHELVHALQDQRYDLTDAAYRADTQDGELAVDGVVEGEANYIEARYSQRCGDEWSCVKPAESGGSGSGADFNLGVYLTIFNPYSDGPVYVADVVEERGWDGFERRFRNPPNSTEQVIHVTDEEPVPIAFNSTARDGWQTYSSLGENGSDTAGEASIYAMFWYQAREYGADTVNPSGLFETTSEYDAYNYDAAPSAGWGNDRVFPYHNGTGEDAGHGYVWVTEWDTESDATEFRETYVRILDAHDVEETEEGYYEIPDGSFADTFAIEQNGTRVTVVNGPDAAAVSDIRPSLSPTNATTTTREPTETETTAADDTATREPTETEPTTTADPTTSETPTGAETTTTGAGFGFAVAALAVALAGLLARFR
ncbi:Hvo_1808 family surface protein [Candidatus Halobonum tyrrellensis]|uniref:Lipoprotein n=1 Tax=Candidatus Halobonum tyrrellensis G22 TaxID=1324957 RepID=V4HI00_9EURY|nr:Hvo_1808 family surface protein [Candidatus Halobonum tyrrellensis]ESP87539.1 lipoprotein [Candidatus Halobonum tyrrellensis G22]